MTRDQIHAERAALQKFIAERRAEREALRQAMVRIETTIQQADSALSGLVLLEGLGPLEQREMATVAIVGRW